MEINFIKETVRSFATGEMDIATFKSKYDESDNINEWLQSIIDKIVEKDIPVIRRTMVIKNVAMNKPFQPKSAVEDFVPRYCINNAFLSPEWRICPSPVKERLKFCNVKTISGAERFFEIVSDIYFQIDPGTVRTEHFFNEYSFMIDVLPTWLAGGEAEEYAVRWIFPQYPESMKKGERKKAIRCALKEAFTIAGNSYPRWIQSSEWPIGTDSIPMIFTGQKGYKEYTEYYFKDKTIGEIKVIRQYW